MDANNPLVSLQETGEASIINYQLPEPTSYRVQNVLDLAFPTTYYQEQYRSSTIYLSEKLGGIDALKGSLKSYLSTGQAGVLGSSASSLTKNFLGVTAETLTKVGKLSASSASTASKITKPGIKIFAASVTAPSSSPASSALDVDTIASAVTQGAVYMIQNSFSGASKEKLIYFPPSFTPTISLILKFRLATYLGDYGAGRVVSTFSLLPGESTTISIKTYKSSTESAEASSSIVESYSETAASEFEEILHEGSSESTEVTATSAHSGNISGGASGTIYGVDLNISGGYESSDQTTETTNTAVDKTLDATTTQSQSASSKRDITINTTTSSTTTEGEEETITRTISNVNVSRTLNFVCRQMNQEFYSLMSLEDVEIGYFGPDGSGTSWTSEKVPLYRLDDLLETYFLSEHIDEVRKRIIFALRDLRDYDGMATDQFIVEASSTLYDGTKKNYWKVNQKYAQTYTSTTGRTITTKGIICGVRTNVIRTDGVIVEALLGQGEALDSYSQGLQKAKVAEKDLANEAQMLENQKVRAALGIVAAKDKDAAAVFETVFETEEDSNDDSSSE